MGGRESQSIAMCLAGHWTTHFAGRISLNPHKSMKYVYHSVHFPDQEAKAQRQEVTAQGHRLMTEPRFDFRSVWL